MKTIQTLIKKYRDWRMIRQIQKACRRTRISVSAMSKEQRRVLYVRALDIAFPNGKWSCDHGHFGIWNAKGRSCSLCGSTENYKVPIIPAVS